MPTGRKKLTIGIPWDRPFKNGPVEQLYLRKEHNVYGCPWAPHPFGGQLPKTAVKRAGWRPEIATLTEHYVTANFTLHDDGEGHVLITDPPVHGHLE